MKRQARAWLASIMVLAVLAPVAQAQDSHEERKEACKEYRERLKKYQREGVLGINPLTGEVRKMDKEQAREVIEDTKENIKLFCF